MAVQSIRVLRVRPLARGRWLPFSLLFVYAVVGGATFAVTKIALGAGVSPLSFATWQCAGAAGVMLVGCALRRLRIPLTAPHAAYYALCGLVGVALPNVNMYAVLARIPAGTMALVVATVPLFTCCLSAFSGTERLSPRRLLGLLSGVAGALVLATPLASGSGPAGPIWIALAFATPLLYGASHVVVARYRPGDADAMALAAGMLVVAAGALAIAALSAGEMYALRWPLGPGEAAVLIQVAISSLCYLIFFRLVDLAGPLFFSQVGYLVTMTGMGWGVAVLGENYNAYALAAVGLVFVGLLLVTPGQGATNPTR